MKKITLSFVLILGLIFTASAQPGCVANGTITPTGNLGEFAIADLSTSSGTNPFTYFISGEPGAAYVYLQPNTTTGTYQYTQNGSYAYGFVVMDSIANCYNTYWDSVIITGLITTTGCQAAFSILQDSTNPGIYWCWNNSTASTPAGTLNYSWSFGDGTSSTLAYPTHTYSGLGVYTVCLTIAEPNSNCTSTYCDTIVVSVKASGTILNVLPPGASASIEENNSFNALTSYPNPIEDKLTISFISTKEKSLSVSIIDLAGKTIARTDFSAQNGQNKLDVNTSDLNSGLYLVRVLDNSNNNAKTLRIIKK